MPLLPSFVIAAALLLAQSGGGSQGAAKHTTFDSQKPGEPPAGFSCELTGGGRPGAWKIVADPTAPSPPNVLGQMDSDTTGYRFPVCVLDGVSASNVEISVRFKPVGGAKDQAAGLVWRYRDNDNYYVARANALEGNVVLYKVQGGKRTDLKPKGAGPQAYGKQANVAKGAWNLLTVIVRGSRFEVRLGGDTLMEVEDATFSGPGRIGVWTKADSVTYFDDLRVEAR